MQENGNDRNPAGSRREFRNPAGIFVWSYLESFPVALLLRVDQREKFGQVLEFLHIVGEERLRILRRCLLGVRQDLAGLSADDVTAGPEA